MKNKGWIIFGIFIIAAIIAFAVYKVSGTTNTSVSTGGGSQTKATNGIGSLLASFTGLFKGSFFGGDNPSEAPLAGDNFDSTDYGTYA